VPNPFGQTTGPGVASTADNQASPPLLALVIVWSAAQPHSIGHVAFFPFGQRLLVGRGDVGIERFARFFLQRPGEVPTLGPDQGLLTGDSVSRSQLEFYSTGVSLEMEKVGSCRTYVNGVEVRDSAVLQPGDTLLLKGEVLRQGTCVTLSQK